MRALPQQDRGEEEPAVDAAVAADGGGWDDDRDEAGEGLAEGGEGSSSVFEGYYRAQELLERSVRPATCCFFVGRRAPGLHRMFVGRRALG